MAAERYFGVKPAGMFYIGLKGGVNTRAGASRRLDRRRCRCREIGVEEAERKNAARRGGDSRRPHRSGARRPGPTAASANAGTSAACSWATEAEAER